VTGVAGAVEGEVTQAVNRASIPFNQDEFVGVQAISMLLVVVQVTTRRSLAVVRSGL
jgi:hypothetical protein